jgi:hypothetical protein
LPPRAKLLAAADDGRGKSARAGLCLTLARSFQRTGEVLRLVGNIFGPQRVDGTSPFGNGEDGLVALGYLCHTAGYLISGATELLDRGNAYGASALNRQLVEVEYLAWAFAEDQEEAAAWLRSDRVERLQRWQPKHLRDRSHGRFRSTDYAEHCELGGHPTPQGARILVEPSTATTQLLQLETANHGLSAWDYVGTAVVVLSGGDGGVRDLLIPADAAEAVWSSERTWRSNDRLASALRAGPQSARA